MKNAFPEHQYHFLQAFIDSFPFYVLLIDEDHHIVMANEAVKRHLGVNRQDIIGGYCPKVVHGSEDPIPQCPLELCVKENTVIEVEYYDDQADIWVSSAIYPLYLPGYSGKNLYIHMVHDISLRKEAELKLKENLNKLKDLTDAGIQALSKVIEYRDPYTAGHQLRVSKLATRIAKGMDLDESLQKAVKVAGLLHDIGKIAVPIEILCKPGKLNKHEFNMIKVHPSSGYNILKDIDFPWAIASIVLQHHERMDGSGYPEGLMGEQILLEARILAVADVVEAMLSHRPYRPALTMQETLTELEKGIGNKYDRAVVNSCLDLSKKELLIFNDAD